MQVSIKKILLLALAAILAAVAGFCVIPVTSYLQGRSAAVDIIFPSETATESITISDEMMDELISGNLTLDDLVIEAGVAVISTDSANSAASARTSVAASPDAGESASADSTSESAAVSDSSASSEGASSAASSASASASSSSAAKGAEGYEAEIKALVQQLYRVKARAESGLNSAIASARAEYKALPQSQQTQAKKVSICFSKASQLSALQASCDSEVNSIVSQMRTILKANGQSTALADQAMASYKSQKSAMYSSLMKQLYS